MSDLHAPFPWFGGKRRCAEMVWERFGNVPNYVEPFFGSGAVLLGRPHAPTTETINDRDGFLANFWRSVSQYPDDVARHADWPVTENDLHARHAWLVGIKEDFVARIEGDPTFCDPHVAGWWVWGICSWIGGGWCSGEGPWGVVGGKLVNDGGQGINRKIVHLGEWFAALSDRLRRVRVCCGDWSRIMGPSPTFRLGLTGVFLDPPYSGDAGRHNEIYACEDLTVARQVNAWCAENGDNQLLRIALCGYEGEHDNLVPLGWDCIAWSAHGGYGAGKGGKGDVNRHRERIWFSPHCLVGRQGRLI